MRERLLDNFELVSADNTCIVLENSLEYRLSVTASSKENVPVFHVRVSGPDRSLPTNTFFGDRAAQVASSKSGRNGSKDTAATLNNEHLEAKLDWSISPILTIKDTKTGEILHEDLSARGYNLSAFGIRHYSRLNRSDLYFGLGEPAAPLNLNGRRFELHTSDSASYDSWQADIQYKHTPLLVRVPAGGKGTCVAYYSTSHADSVWDIGRSIDEPWGAYKAFEVETGALDFYIFAGSLPHISKTLATLTGAVPLMPPRWALGYISSPQGLAAMDNPTGQDLTERFLKNLQDRDIPSSAIQFSSSYTVTPTEKGVARNVFTLNTHRFPDFSGFCKQAHELGMRVVPNIKPYINIYHPDFKKVADGDGLFYDPDRKGPVRTWIWSMGIGDKLVGGWLDTSSKAGFNWWKQGASQLIQMGVDGLWNDNDEYSLHDDEYLAGWDIPGLPESGQGKKKVGLVGRTTFTELLGRSSFEALEENSPGRRPYILTRSANLNTMKYCCATWSGDNRSDWDALKGNAIMTINASMCLYHSYGSDVGGFAGPLPTPELFVRWCQLLAYHTRFCINSIHTNPDNPDQFSVNSPWMHDEVLPIIRNVIKRRYEVLPYMYGLHHESRTMQSPPVAMLGWGEFSNDPNLFTKEAMQSGDFWLGAGRLLVAGVFAAGQKSREVYLPSTGKDDKEVYYKLFPPYDTARAGTTVTAETPLEHIPVFARSGSVIPVGKPCATITSKDTITSTTNDGTVIKLKPGFVELDDWRGVEIFPAPGSHKQYEGEWFEDDGESTWPCPIARVKVVYSSTKESVTVKARFEEKDFTPLWESLWVILPVGDSRKVEGAVSTTEYKDGRTIFEMKVSSA